MSIFAIKNNEGKWLGCEIYCDEPDWFEHGGFMWDTRSVAEENVKLYGGHVVELGKHSADGNITDEETVTKVLREVKRYADDYISEDTLKFEIKMALNAYKHVVKPAPEVVSEDEAEILEQAKNMINPMHLLWMNELTHNGDSDGQSRLLRAYVNGWTVAKPKRWNVKVPHAEKTLYRKHDSGALFASIYVGQQNHANDFLFTDSEIIKYGLQDCEQLEVTDDEQ